MLEPTTTVHPIPSSFLLVFFLFFSPFFSSLPPSLFPYAPPFVPALFSTRVFDYDRISCYAAGACNLEAAASLETMTGRGRIRLGDFNFRSREGETEGRGEVAAG